MVFLDCFFQALNFIVHGVGFEEDFRAAAPDHYEPIDAVVLFKALNVLAHFQHHAPFVFARFDVRSFQAAHVVAIKNGFHWFDRAQAFLDGVERIFF